MSANNLVMKHALKALAPMASSALDMLFNAASEYEDKNIKPMLKEGESNAALLIFKKETAYYASIVIFDNNKTITRRIPFTENTIEVPVKELIEQLLKKV